MRGASEVKRTRRINAREGERVRERRDRKREHASTATGRDNRIFKFSLYCVTLTLFCPSDGDGFSVVT